MSTPERPSITVLTVVDTPDLQASATFYGSLLGVEVVRTDDDWIAFAPTADGFRLALQLATEYTAPTWPDPAVGQQLHLDLHVPDLDEAERFVLSIGARPIDGPGADPTFRVYLDPVGHPFCLCEA